VRDPSLHVRLSGSVYSLPACQWRFASITIYVESFFTLSAPPIPRTPRSLTRTNLPLGVGVEPVYEGQRPPDPARPRPTPPPSPQPPLVAAFIISPPTQAAPR
jgi:hypothetical protein